MDKLDFAVVLALIIVFFAGMAAHHCMVPPRIITKIKDVPNVDLENLQWGLDEEFVNCQILFQKMGFTVEPFNFTDYWGNPHFFAVSSIKEFVLVASEMNYIYDEYRLYVDVVPFIIYYGTDAVECLRSHYFWFPALAGDGSQSTPIRYDLIMQYNTPQSLNVTVDTIEDGG